MITRIAILTIVRPSLCLLFLGHARRSARQEAVPIRPESPQGLTDRHGEVDPPLVSVRQAFLIVALLVLEVEALRCLRARRAITDLELPETDLSTSTTALRASPQLLALLLGLDPHLPNTGHLRRRRLWVLESGPTFLAICRKHRRSLACTFQAAVASEPPAQRRGERDLRGLVVSGTTWAEDGFGDLHGRRRRETRREANKELASAVAAAAIDACRAMGSIRVHPAPFLVFFTVI